MKKIKLILVFVLLSTMMSYAQEGMTADKRTVKVSPTVALHGRVQYDFEFLQKKFSSDSTTHVNGSEFRRVYLSGSGNISKNIKYKAQFEFAGAKIGYRDVYIKFTNLAGIGGNLTFGSFGEPTGLEMATSSKYIPFFERAMLTSTQNFRWNSGFMYDNFGLFGDKLGLQLSYAFNGNQHGGFKDTKINEGGHFVARLTSAIINDKSNHKLVHLGINFENRKRSKNPADYTLKFRTENHMWPDKTTLRFTDLKKQTDVGFELATDFGPFSFQGEYEIANYITTAKTYQVNGYYAAISYFLTGDHRAYKHGAYGRVKPKKNVSFKDKTYGAVELVARYSVEDFSSLVNTETNNKVANIDLGLNWYLNAHTRFMYNFNISNFNEAGSNNKLYANVFRVQTDF